jgi:hypothetical protein
MSARRVLSKALLALCVVGLWMLGSVSVSLAASAPSIQSESPREVSYESAAIEAQIDPMETATTYHVEYGLTASYGMRAPVSDAAVGSGSEYVTVKQPLYNLFADSTYHFRVVATNASGTTEGPDYVLRTPALPPGGADDCPNAAVRALQHASLLPECRAYEMVSPVEKAGGDIAAVPRRTQAAVDGDSIKYFSRTAFGDAIGSESPGAEYIAKRGEGGWSTHSINPEQYSDFFATITPPSYTAISPDLTKGVFFGRSPVIPGHANVEDVSNLYLRTDLQSPGPGDYQLLSDAVAPVEANGTGVFPQISFDGASADWSHVLFEAYADLTADTSGMDRTLPKLYEWHNGAVTFAGVLPDSACGTPPCLASESVGGSGAGLQAPFIGGSGGRPIQPDWTTNSISADGSRIVFEADPLTTIESGFIDVLQTFGNLYMRIDKASTVQLNASERSTPDPSGNQPARFLAATADDSRVFFETTEALTEDTETPDHNIYMYEVEAPAGKHLTLITPDADPGNGLPKVEKSPQPAISQDGHFIYFFGFRPLVPGQPEIPQGTVGLYVWHDGTIRYVTSHTDAKASDSNDPKWGEGGSTKWAPDDFRMSANGRKIAFISSFSYVAQQAGVRNGDHKEIYVYDYDTGKITCASCDPSGELPTSDAQFETQANATLANGIQYLSNVMSRDGRYVFFDTGESLVPPDTNGRRDVYDFDTVTGEAHLLSDGRCGCDATFAEASPDAHDVFFTTREQLVRTDVDDNADLYDARVEGGIAVQNEAPPAVCDGEECRGPAVSPPVFSVPSSASFAGAGNPKPPLAKVKAKAKRPTLAQALRVCKRKPKSQRARCRARVRRAYHANRATRVQVSRRTGR